MRSWSVQDLEETPKLLMEVWEIRKHADKQTQADLAESIARLWIKKEDHQSAQKFLNDEEIIVINADFSEDLHIRYYIPILYHRAVIHYRKQDYALARGGFSAVLENANKIQWHRVISSSKNWLADIAIEENDRDTAKRLIIEGLIIGELAIEGLIIRELDIEGLIICELAIDIFLKLNCGIGIELFFDELLKFGSFDTGVLNGGTGIITELAEVIVL
jgi:hypothetical protein